MYGYIYLTTNLINNKKYIGKKKSNYFLEENYLGSGIRLKEAVCKYGKENFSVQLLEECNSEASLNEKEKYYIKLYNAVSSKDFYNIAHGGDGGILWEEGHHPSLGRRRSGESNPFYGKHHTKEEIERQKKSFRKSLENNYTPPTKNKHRIRKDGVIRYVSLEEAYLLLQDGWTCSYIDRLEWEKLVQEGLATVGMKGKHQSDYQKQKASETHKNKIVLKSQIEKFKKTMSSKTEEEKLLRAQHCREAQEKMRWVIKEGCKPFRIHVEELDNYISMGYHQGRK